MAALARIPFTPQTEKVIGQMAGWMMFVAIVHIVLGLLFATGGAVGGGALALTFGDRLGAGALAMGIGLALVYGLLGLVLALEGFLLIRARSAFNAVVDTDTNDQEHLSTALRRLKVFFLVEVILGALASLGSVIQIAIVIAAPALTDMSALQVGS